MRHFEGTDRSFALYTAFPCSLDGRHTVDYYEDSVTLDVHFISSLPVILQSACKAWVDRKPVQIVVAED